jgi:hypothetical protein
MDEPLEIPDAVYDAAHQTGAIKYSAVLRAAAPLIVATELRRLATEWEDNYPFERATRLHDRANELDPNNPS